MTAQTATAPAALLRELPVGTLLINPADGTTYRRTTDFDWHIEGDDAPNWRSSSTRGESGTVGSGEFRLLQIELNRGGLVIAWSPTA